MAKEKKELIVGINGDLSDNFTTPQKAVLGLQNTLAMCGVILVPILCGLDVSVTLFCAGIGTIIYQFIDKKMVPAFLGGSFAIIAGVSTVVGEMGIPYAQGGILGMAVFYLLFALLLKILGKDRVARVFPPIIVGPIIMVLGLSLASVGVQEAEANWPIAIITFLIAVGDLRSVAAIDAAVHDSVCRAVLRGLLRVRGLACETAWRTGRPAARSEGWAEGLNLSARPVDLEE